MTIISPNPRHNLSVRCTISARWNSNWHLLKPTYSLWWLTGWPPCQTRACPMSWSGLIERFSWVKHCLIRSEFMRLLQQLKIEDPTRLKESGIGKSVLSTCLYLSLPKARRWCTCTDIQRSQRLTRSWLVTLSMIGQGREYLWLTGFDNLSQTNLPQGSWPFPHDKGG